MTGKMGEKDSREDVVKVFAMFDDDSTNKISFRNLARVAEELGEAVDDEELRDMINQSDKDGDGEINFDEFYRIMKKKGNFLRTFHPMMTWRPHQRSVKQLQCTSHKKCKNDWLLCPVADWSLVTRKSTEHVDGENAFNLALLTRLVHKNTNKNNQMR